MKQIIPIILLAMASISAVSCKSQPTMAATETKEAVTEKKSIKIEHLTAETFKTKVFNYTESEYKFIGEKPCIIDFYASWCGPCKMMAPTIQAVADEYGDQITVYKVDVDAQKELAGSFGITGIPTLLFCPKNEKPQMSSGLLSKADFDRVVKDVLLK